MPSYDHFHICTKSLEEGRVQQDLLEGAWLGHVWVVGGHTANELAEVSTWDRDRKAALTASSLLTQSHQINETS